LSQSGTQFLVATRFRPAELHHSPDQDFEWGRPALTSSRAHPRRARHELRRLPLNFAVTGGQVHDSQVVGNVLDTPKPPLAVTADKAYDRGPPADQTRRCVADHSEPLRWRRIATRYDKLARNFLAATALVGALDRIKF
jgi:hypothetical protein